jgi:hypothetical protein
MNLIFQTSMLRCIVMEVIWKAASPFPFFVQVISFAFIQLSLVFFGGSKTDLILYIQIYYIIFVLSKYLIENNRYRIPHWGIVEQFNLQKVTYRTYIGFILPINIILFYYDTISINIINNHIYSIVNQRYNLLFQ